MKAITQRSFGGTEVFEIVDVPVPKPIPTEVLVRVHAVALNPVEAAIRRGSFPVLGPPPFTLGWDISGVVEAVEPGVTRFEVGDEVYGMPLFPRAANGYAEYVVSPSRHLAKKPRSIDHAHAAAIPLAALTAWQSFVDVAKIEPGQRVLIHAAGGGVGHFAVQIAKELGAHVIATASAGKRDFVLGLGADEVVDYRAVDFAEAVRDVDVVFEAVGRDYARRSLRTLRPGGLLLTITERRDLALAEEVRRGGYRFAGVTVEPEHRALETLAEWVDRGRLRAHVEETFPLTEVARAHTRLEQGNVQGKLVLTV